ALNPAKGKKAITCGLVTAIRQILTKRGKKLTIIGLEDARHKMDVVVFSEIYEPQQAHVQTGKMIVIEGELGQDDYSGGVKMTATRLYRIEDARTRFAKCLALTLTHADQDRMVDIQSILKAYQGDCLVQIRYSNVAAKATMTLARSWGVTPDDELLAKLGDLMGQQCVEISY
ncbi:OB-fold nucleic acid binding domain-containing protein, partial [bacterium]|nr:OB-fold nucleic acid binding domain-containing protein [bacterium]